MDKQNKQNTIIKRRYLPGENWVYYKLFSGPKFVERILLKKLWPLIHEFLNKGYIDKWFFLRYNESGEHIRLRLHATNTELVGQLINMISNVLSPFVENDLIWKLELDTYTRELERYGAESMELVETIFWYDSEMIVSFLNHLGGESPDERWLSSLVMVDRLLSDFSFDMKKKHELTGMWHNYMGEEFGGINKPLKVGIDYKFRKFKEDIATFMDQLNHSFLMKILDAKSARVRPVLREYDELQNSDGTIPDREILVSSLSHMMLNRLFYSRQRFQEMVVYGILARYYSSYLKRNYYKNLKNKV